MPSSSPRFPNATSQGSVCFASRTPAFTSRSSPSVLPSCASSGGRIGRNTTRGTRQDRRRSITPSTPCNFSFPSLGGDVKIVVPTSGFAWLTRIRQNYLKRQQCRLFSRPRIGIRIVPTPVPSLSLLKGLKYHQSGRACQGSGFQCWREYLETLVSLRVGANAVAPW